MELVMFLCGAYLMFCRMRVFTDATFDKHLGVYGSNEKLDEQERGSLFMELFQPSVIIKFILWVPLFPRNLATEGVDGFQEGNLADFLPILE